MASLVAAFLAMAITAVSCNGVAPWWRMNDGKNIPAFGLGTWLGFSSTGRVIPKGDEVEKAVEWAIDAGYRHIDTAAIYATEGQVGRAIQKKISEGVIKREDIFITTKLWCDKHKKEDVIPALRESLQILNLEYVDLYLIHWPIALDKNGSLSNTDYLETWEGMIEARNSGLTRSIGLSNFNQKQMDRLISSTGVKPAVLEVELNLNLQQPELLAYCKNEDIKVIGYTPFGSLFYNKAKPDAPAPRIDDPTLTKIASKYNKTVPQVTLRYLLELDVIQIPKSITQSRVEQNLQVFDFSLSAEDKELLKAFDKHYRTIPVLNWKQSLFYPFE